MEKKMRERYVALLRDEMVLALGCTEPIAIAYAAACAREVLGCEPDGLELACSGCVIKNAHSVVVPNSLGLKGIEAAAVLGALAGRARAKLRVLEGVTREDVLRAREWQGTHGCVCRLAQGVDNLYICVTAKAGFDSATVIVSGSHTHIASVIHNGKIVFEGEEAEACEAAQLDLSIDQVLEFANEVELCTLEDVLETEIQCNGAISQKGLSGEYGLNIGRALLRAHGEGDVRIRARAAAAAGSDARMNGCPTAVVINSGSGNQGMTVSLPVIEYAKAYQVPKERLYRALIVSNLVAIAQKRHIGSLSAYCGAVCAAAGAGAGIAYMLGYGYREISAVITYTLGTIGGMVCDGAKSSCAAKIAAALDVALTGFEIAVASGHTFEPGDGLIQRNVDDTIASMGRVGRDGMRQTNAEILSIMLKA